MLDTWVVSSTKGASTIYYRGLLSRDRQTSELIKGEFNFALKEASLAYALYEAGMVNLVQRRKGDGDYEYIAQRK